VCTMWENYPSIFFGGLASTSSQKTCGIIFQRVSVRWPS